VVVSRSQPANIAFEHAVDLFAIIWARPGFYRPHFTLVLVHKCQGEGTIAFIADKNGYHPEAHLVWTEHIGAVTFQLCLELPRGKGDGGPGRGGRGAGGGADVPGTDVATAPPHATKTAAAAMMGAVS